MSPIIYGGSSGGGSTPVSCMLAVDTPLSIRTATQVPLFWDALYDNAKDITPIAAIPTGLGLSFAFDGSSADITTTAAGVWSFSYNIFRDNDATWVGSLKVPTLSRSYQLVAASSDASSVVTDVLALPSGTTFGPLFAVETQATANPYTASVYLVFVRLG